VRLSATRPPAGSEKSSGNIEKNRENQRLARFHADSRVRLWPSAAEEKRENAIATKEHIEHKRKIAFYVLFSSAKACLLGQAEADVPFYGQFISRFPGPLSPRQNVKEQAPERLIYSTLPRFDGNASTII
jgi:hypothetical protein